MSQVEFDPINGILRCRLEGLVSDGELIDYYRIVAQHVTRLTPRAGIADLSAVTRFQVLPTTLRSLADSQPALSDPAVPRFIVAPNDYTYGMSRLFQGYGEKKRPNLYVVRKAEEVWEMLNIQEPRFEPLGS
jgi:hypothetical protein